MADRYWVGGTGTWDASDTSHWSTSSGGASGASVPTSSDNVIFNSASHTTDYTVTIGATSNCLDITFSAPSSGNVTLAGSSILNFYGNFTLYSGLVRTFTGPLNGSKTSGTQTFTSAGVSLGGVILTASGVGGTLQFVGNYTSTSSVIVLINCALDFNGVTVSCGTLSCSGTLTFGAATVSISGNISFSGGSTINAGSIVSITQTGQSCLMGSHSFGGTVSLNNANHDLDGGNTFNNLTFAPSGAANILLSGNNTISGTLTITGINNTTQRCLIRSSVRGTPRTLTAATVTVTNADFQDITGAGAGSWNLSAISGGSGDCGGNSGITFTTPVTNYWIGGTGNVSDVNEWASSSGGGAGTGRVPLPQDTARFDANSFSGGSQSVTQDMPRIGTVNWTGVTNTPQYNINTIAVAVFGSFIMSSGMTFPGVNSGTWTFEGRGSHTIDLAGLTFTRMFSFNQYTGTYTLLSAFANDIASVGMNFLSGTFTTNNFNVSTNSITANGTATLVMNLGSSLIIVGNTGGGGGSGELIFSAVMTLNAGTSTIRLTGALATLFEFNGGGKTFYNFEIATTNAFTHRITGSNTFNNIHIDASAAPRTLHFTAGTTTTVTSFTRDVGTNIITITSSSAAQHTLVNASGTPITLSYISISRSTATPSGSMWVATNSTDGFTTGLNSGWDFGFKPPVVLRAK